MGIKCPSAPLMVSPSNHERKTSPLILSLSKGERRVLETWSRVA
jgi:hypothetical protein